MREGVGGEGTEGRQRLKSFGMPVGCRFTQQRSLLATFRCVRPSVMKPRNGLAPRFAIMAQGKNRHLPRSYPNPVMNKGLHAKMSRLSLRRGASPRSYWPDYKNELAQINSII